MKKREMALVSAVARTGSVTVSALEVGMSQPAASALLKQLEERLGIELFIRQRRRLELTADCRALLPEINHALSALESVDRLTSSMGAGKPMRLVIGAVPAASAGVLPQALREVLLERPQMAVVVRAGTALEVVEMAVQQRIDLGLIYGTAVHEHLSSECIAPLSLVCVLPRSHPFAALTSISVGQLAGVPYVAHSRFLPVGALTALALEAEGHTFAPRVEVMQFSAACAMAEAGIGVAVLESVAATYAEGHGLVAIPFAAPSDLNFTAVWSPSRGLGAVPRKVLRALHAAFGDGSSPPHRA